MKRFTIVYREEAAEFLRSLPENVRKKIEGNLTKSQYVMNSELFKKLSGTDIWEFRTRYRGNSYRLLAFWDTEKNALVIAANGFQKKTQKTPQKEIEKAEAIRKDYFSNKK